jgi:hypothetical protein
MGFTREDVRGESRYVSGDDVKAAGGLIDGTVAYCLQEQVGEEKKDKLVLHFSVATGATKQPIVPIKPLILNNINANVLFDGLGDDSDQWPGGKVRLVWDASVQYRGRIVGGVRVRAAKPAAQPAPLPPLGAGNSDLADEIPF